MTHDTYTGKFLIAMPGMGDERFEKSVIYICSHTSEGAMGLVINHPAALINFSQLLKELKIPAPATLPELPIYLGGPVEKGRGFVLHSSEYIKPSTLIVSDTIALTATTEILKAVADDKGPHSHMLILGYTGWGAGQLEREMQDNAWHVSDADDQIIFATANENKWSRAMASMGIDVSMLSSEIGHA